MGLLQHHGALTEQYPGFTLNKGSSGSIKLMEGKAPRKHSQHGEKQHRFYWSCTSVVMKDATLMTLTSAWAKLFPNINNIQSMIPEDQKNITRQYSLSRRFGYYTYDSTGVTFLQACVYLCYVYYVIFIMKPACGKLDISVTFTWVFVHVCVRPCRYFIIDRRILKLLL